SPAEQGERENKAAAVPLFRLHMAKDLWDRTSNAPGKEKIENPHNLVEGPGGMATVELTGPQMVDYLRKLDYNSHNPVLGDDRPLARAVYNAAAAVIDRIEVPPAPGAAVPEIVVDAAVPAEDSSAK